MSDNLIVGLDIGTTKVAAVIGEFNENGILEIIGVGKAPSTGLRKGVVVNIESTLKSVAQAVESAELMSGREVHSVFTGIGGSHMEGINSRGVVAVAGRGREITKEDVARVIEAARAVVIPMDREVFHVIPQTFIVDDQTGVRDPVDMIGVRLEGEVHIITGSVSAAQNLVKCVNRAGFKVEELSHGSLAAARATLTKEERDLGCLLIDMGGGTTDALVYSDGAPFFTAVIPVGGAQVTGDLSIIFGMPQDTAERIKIESGACHESMVEADEKVIIPGVAGRPPREIARREICVVIQPRIEEVFMLVRERLERNGALGKLGGGIVLTGGASCMPGACELATRVFGVQARLGNPVVVGGLVEEYRNPVFSTAVGLILQAAEKMSVSAEKPERAETPHRMGTVSKIVNWLRNEFF